MNSEKFNEYLTNRYSGQIQWYSNSASKNKRWYHVFQWGVIVLSAVVPVLVAYVPDEYKYLTIIVSILLAIGTAALKTFKFQENWINYRTVSETLKKEKSFYDAGLDEYGSAEDREALFVERVESLISRENSLWMVTHKQKIEEEKNKKK